MKITLFPGFTKSGKKAYFGNHPTDAKLICVVADTLVAGDKILLTASNDGSVYFGKRAADGIEVTID